MSSSGESEILLRHHLPERQVHSHTVAPFPGWQGVVPHLVGGWVHHEEIAVLEEELHCNTREDVVAEISAGTESGEGRTVGRGKEGWGGASASFTFPLYTTLLV